jgi:ElaB/YqjD/DUF883 family membrane-anchored ribosome-binding protein
MATSSTSSTNTGTQKQQFDRLADSAHGAIDRAAQAASQVAERFGERSDELLAMKDDYVEAARDYVKENPFVALGIALAAGYLFGKITSWR